ncbi:MAG: LolA-related protein [Leptospirales bacterium]
MRLLKSLEWGFKYCFRIAVFVAVFCLGVGTFAISGAEDLTGHAGVRQWNLQSLMQGLAQVKSDNPHFVQRQYLHDLAKPLVSSGVLVYQSPDYLEQKTELPSPQRAIIRGDQLTLYSSAWHGPRNLSLKNTPDIWAVVVSLRATLSGQLPILQRYFNVRMNGSSRQWQLAFKPRIRTLQKRLGSILITGRDVRIDRIEIHYIHGNYSIMRLHRNPP